MSNEDINAMREIVEEVAKNPMAWPFGGGMYLCNFCDAYIGGVFGRTDHRAKCPISKAQSLVAQWKTAQPAPDADTRERPAAPTVVMARWDTREVW